MAGDSSDVRRNALPYGDLAAITGNENLLVLAPSPGDESVACGGLVAESCRRGRPPFIMVLGDGTSSHPGLAAGSLDDLARVHDRETRRAVRCLGLQNERLLMAGLYDGQIPEAGPAFAAVVRAVALVMWARDCNVICAPWPDPGATAAERATYRIAQAVSAASGVGLLAWARDDAPGIEAGAAQAWRLDIAPRLDLKRQAVAAHAVKFGEPPEIGDYEVFLRPAA